MILENLEFIYEKGSGSFCFQGNQSKLRKKLNEGYILVGGGNGSYVLAEPNKVGVYADCNGERNFFSLKPLIRNYYGCRRVTLNKFEKFEEEILQNGNKLDYDEYEGLRII